ncbi:hypothetical protein KOR42_45370 [Thalassoglobus neptunius]|uniref:Uncharacterized protein n=2 Tax=Thalassoglobus neptunius TaxID=1938619 RepID=A0A5C5VY00_9PLAN|nr:hypothetical protein KOR42_45370 [Thalassoglobus neptunius]
MRSFSFDISRDLFFNNDGELTDLGKKHLTFLAGQMKRLPFDLTINTPSTQNIVDTTKLATYLIMDNGVSLQQVAVGVLTNSDIPPQKLRLVLNHEE